jgi:hypothetical protein
VHQPSLLTIEHVGTERPNHVITRFDLALDLIVTSASTQVLLYNFLRQHLTQPWRGKRERTVYKGTVYLGPASTRRNVALYRSSSKITSQPAVHLELRYIAADACRRRGVHRITDLSALDIDSCIRRDMRFSTICWRIADKSFDRLAEEAVRQHANREDTVKAPSTIYSRISVESARRRLVDLFLRSMQDENQVLRWSDRADFATQKCIDTLRALNDDAVHVPLTTLIKSQPCLIWP